MTGYLLDTNVVSELRKPAGRREEKVIRWVDAVSESFIHISVLTIGEIRRGIVQHDDPVWRARSEVWLRQALQSRFAGRIVAVDQGIAERWGALSAASWRAGRSLHPIDGLLAATALDRALTVVTRNVQHFTFAGIPVINPWDAGSGAP